MDAAWRHRCAIERRPGRGVRSLAPWIALVLAAAAASGEDHRSDALEDTNIAAARNGGRIVAVSSEARDPEHRPPQWQARNLIDGKRVVKGRAPADSYGWCSARAPAPGRPEWVTIGLPGRVPWPIERIAIDPATRDPWLIGRWVREVEVQVSTSDPSGPYRTVARFVVPNKPGLHYFDIPDCEARYVKLVILSNHGSDRCVEMGEVEVHTEPYELQSRELVREFVDALSRTGAFSSGSSPGGSQGGRPGSRPPRHDRHFAVVIGVDGYPEEVGRLHCCCNDARAVAEALKSCCGVPEDNIFVISDDQPSPNWRPALRNIYRVLNQLARRARKEPIERVYFFLAGHGYQIGRENYYLMPDVAPGDLEADVAADVLPNKSLPLSKLKEKLQAIGAPQVLVMLDACRNELRVAGRGVGGRDLSVEMAEAVGRLRLPRGFVVIRATSGGQRSGEWREKQHGLFTYVLLEALRGAADDNRDGEITLNELEEYLQERTPKAAMRAGLPLQEPTVMYVEEVTNAGRYVVAWVGR